MKRKEFIYMNSVGWLSWVGNQGGWGNRIKCKLFSRYCFGGRLTAAYCIIKNNGIKADHAPLNGIAHVGVRSKWDQRGQAAQAGVHPCVTPAAVLVRRPCLHLRPHRWCCTARRKRRSLNSGLETDGGGWSRASHRDSGGTTATSHCGSERPCKGQRAEVRAARLVICFTWEEEAGMYLASESFCSWGPDKSHSRLEMKRRQDLIHSLRAVLVWIINPSGITKPKINHSPSTDIQWCVKEKLDFVYYILRKKTDLKHFHQELLKRFRVPI